MNLWRHAVVYRRTYLLTVRVYVCSRVLPEVREAVRGRSSKHVAILVRELVDEGVQTPDERLDAMGVTTYHSPGSLSVTKR
jgi:hypothetical protein